MKFGVWIWYIPEKNIQQNRENSCLAQCVAMFLCGNQSCCWVVRIIQFHSFYGAILQAPSAKGRMLTKKCWKFYNFQSWRRPNISQTFFDRCVRPDQNVSNVEPRWRIFLFQSRLLCNSNYSPPLSFSPQVSKSPPQNTGKLDPGTASTFPPQTRPHRALTILPILPRALWSPSLAYYPPKTWMDACVGVFVFCTSTIFLCYLDNRVRVERSQCRGTDETPFRQHKGLTDGHWWSQPSFNQLGSKFWVKLDQNVPCFQVKILKKRKGRHSGNRRNSSPAITSKDDQTWTCLDRNALVLGQNGPKGVSKYSKKRFAAILPT